MQAYKSIIFTLFFFVITCQTQAQYSASLPANPEPKREFRGVWIATVVNIDWPINAKASPDKQKSDLLAMLDAQQRNGMNAIILQVRPAADAFYAKSSEPWSKYLTGKQGQAPDPFYDPLQFAITEAHKRGMELHAWFNPYRATFDSNFSSLAPNHITRLKPEWFFTYGGIKQFNPGIPEVRQYIVKVILDVVKNYDIDGVHMDDYFYPYAISGQKINDAETFKQYNNGFDDIKDWRRNNVDLLIKMLDDSIHKQNPRVKFGISPFGVWANKPHHPNGSVSAGLETFYELYADSRKWMKEGWVDYMVPQLYRPINDRLIDFAKLVDWWSDNTFGRHLYVGHAAYRINEHKLGAYQNPAEMPNEIKYLRQNPRIEGSVFFSSTSVLNNPLGFADSLKQHYYRYPALPPLMIWRDSIAPNAPQQLTARAERKGVVLTWLAPDMAKDNEPVYGYVIYRLPENEKFDISNPKNIIHIQYTPELTYTDTMAEKGKNYIYLVTAIDRIKNESEPSQPVPVTARNETINGRRTL
jgi:uncharacterized lipoprotein YddW (UPF0748 family)